MGHSVMKKEDFLRWISTQIKDDEIVVTSSDIDGNMSASIKKNQQKIPFSFPANVFKRPGDVGHIAFGKTISAAICICKPETLSDEINKALNN